MALGIVLRTLCGCERVLHILDRDYPPTWRIPYVSFGVHHFRTGDSMDSLVTSCEGYKVRNFERTSVIGIYDYPVYLEVV